MLWLSVTGRELVLIDHFGDLWAADATESPMETAMGYAFWNAKFRDWLRSQEGAEVVMCW